MNQEVPVFIDCVKEYGSFSMTRCTYFSIVSETPLVGLNLDYRGAKIPVLAIGLEGVIIKPAGRNKYFTGKDQIDALISQIESGEELYFDVNDIWLPNFLFYRKSNKRGNLFRIPVELFILAHHFRYNRLSKEEFLRKTEQFTPKVFFSQKETLVFREWEKSVIDAAKNQYPKNKKYKLEYKDI